MARLKSVRGEKPLFWIGSAKSDLLRFPEDVKDEIGVALSVAQFGAKHPKAKPWRGEGPGVFEPVEDYDGDTYRAVYTVKVFKRRLCVACVSEEIQAWDCHAEGRIGSDRTTAKTCERRL